MRFAALALLFALAPVAHAQEAEESPTPQPPVELPAPTPVPTPDPFPPPEPVVPPPPKRLNPVQGDLALAIANGGAVFGAGYLGVAFGDIGEPGGFFSRAGFDVTYFRARRGHRDGWTVGLASGFGSARMSAHRAVPDSYVYCKITPFLATGGDPQATDDEGLRGGARVSLGITVPAWTRAGGKWLYDTDAFAYDPCGFSVVALVAILLNHVEVGWETSGENVSHLEDRFTVRIGTGF